MPWWRQAGDPAPRDSAARVTRYRLELAAGSLGLLLTGCIQTPPPAVQTGILLAATPVDQAGETMGAGAVAGVVIGAAAGGALGSGAGRVLGAAVGAAVGGTAGASAEAAAQPRDGAAYTVKLADNQVLTIMQHLRNGEAMLQPGQAVSVETQGHSQRVLPVFTAR